MNLNFFRDVDESSFWLTCWSILGLVIVLAITVGGYYSVEEDKIVAQLIREGHDPLELECLYGNSESDMCRTLASTRLQKAILGKADVKKLLKK